MTRTTTPNRPQPAPPRPVAALPLALQMVARQAAIDAIRADLARYGPRPAGPSAGERWQAAVTEKVKGGMLRSAAIESVMREQPQLTRAYNAEAAASRLAKAPAPAPSPQARARAAWDAAIAERVQRGMPRSEAIATVMREQPALAEALR